MNWLKKLIFGNPEETVIPAQYFSVDVSFKTKTSEHIRETLFLCFQPKNEEDYPNFLSMLFFGLSIHSVWKGIIDYYKRSFNPKITTFELICYIMDNSDIKINKFDSQNHIDMFYKHCPDYKIKECVNLWPEMIKAIQSTNISERK